MTIDDTFVKTDIEIAAMCERLIDFISEQPADTLVLEGHPGETLETRKSVILDMQDEKLG